MQLTYRETKRDVVASRVLSRSGASELCHILRNTRPAMKLSLLVGLCDAFFFETDDIKPIGKCFDPGESQLEAYVAVMAHVTDLPRARASLEELLGREIYHGAYKRLAGNLFNWNRANITGHYKLDMSVLGDRMVLKRLMEVGSEQQRFRRLEGAKADNSQKGNNEFWRNETLDTCGLVRIPDEDGEEVLTLFAMQCNGWAVPGRGFLEFDVASLIRPPEEAAEMEPEPFDKVYQEASQKFDDGIQNYLDWMRWEASKFPDRYFSAEQVLKLLQLQDAKTGVKEGMDRIEGFTVVWERIVDEENLDCVMETFSAKDTQKIRKRIGTLNTFNPFAADGPYELDFGIPEDRVLASILIRLDATEDGDSILDQRYTEMIMKKDPDDPKKEIGPIEIVWGDPNAKTEDGEPDPKLSKPWTYPVGDKGGWTSDPDSLPERNPHGGPIWEFVFKTIVENYNERREIAEFLGWEFDEDPTLTPN